jgi:hypothetical protein
MRRRLLYCIGCCLLALLTLNLPTPVAAQTPTPTPPPVLLFRSDFTTRAERWRLLELKKAAIRYMEDGLQLEITPANYALWSIPDTDLRPEQFDISLTGNWTSGAQDAEFGIVVQYRADTDMEVVTVSRGGRVRAGAYYYGVFTDQVAPAQVTLEADKPTTLRAEFRKAKDAKITLQILVNGAKALTVPLDAADGKAGAFGIFAISGTDAGAAITFSDFTVTQPR